MYDLFNPIPDDLNSINTQHSIINDVSSIEGLNYIPSFITKDEERALLNVINAQPWLSDIKRRVQHYGYKYDYKARTINYAMYLGPLPDWSIPYAEKIFENNFIEEFPDQLIINEYLPGQGITNHIDCEPCFGETITSLSLGSCCVMDFINVITHEKVEIMMEPCSLVVINGPARHIWTHGIAQRKADIFKGRKYPRKLRVSLTFRKVILRK